MAMTGTVGLVELPQSSGWDPRTGATIIRRWRGSQEMVERGAVDLKSAGIRYQIEPSMDGGYWVLVGTYGADETQSPEVPLSDVWSLVGNDLEKSIWDHPKIQGQWDRLRQGLWPFTEVTNTAIQTLRSHIEAYVRGDRTVTVNNVILPIDLTIISTLVTSLGLDVPVFAGLISAMSLGVESFSVSQWVLRHTVVVSARSSLRPSMLNVNRVFTTAALISVEAIPPTIMFELAPGWWLKRTPTVEQTASDKFTITQEFWHADSYDMFIYEMAT